MAYYARNEEISLKIVYKYWKTYIIMKIHNHVLVCDFFFKIPGSIFSNFESRTDTWLVHFPKKENCVLVRDFDFIILGSILKLSKISYQLILLKNKI